MSKRLFFIHDLLQALEEEEKNVSFQTALRKILQKENEPEYREGFENFILFMQEANRHRIPAGFSEDEWNQLLDSWTGPLQPSEKDTPPPIIEIVCQNEIVERFVRPQEGLYWGTVSGLLPDSYSLRLSSGWVIWEGDLDARQLLWSEAFPEMPFPLAADAKGEEAVISCRIEFLQGEMEMRIYPGLENGRIELYSVRKQR